MKYSFFFVILMWKGRGTMKDYPEINFIHYAFKRTESVAPLAAQKIPYMDLTYCIEGEMHYVYEGDEYTLNSGDAILYPQGSMRRRLATDAPALYASFNIRCQEGFSPAVFGVLRKSVRSDTAQMLESIRKSYELLSEEKNHKCTALFYYLYYQLIETARENENPHIKHIKRYIAAHLGEKITLDEIAEAVHLVPHYCCALFSKHEGMGIVEFILAQRIQLAKSLIAVDTMGLAEIAERVGFSDYNYFSRTFKKITGVTASQYRKNTIAIE